MTTSISGSRSSWRWAALAQLGVIGHAVMFGIYLQSGAIVYAIAVLLVLVVLSYAALSLAWDAGTKFPTGDRNA